MADLPVAEIFGPTVQGEGPYSGRLSTFIRLGGCNLSCSWCDSAFTWDAARHNLRNSIKSTSVDRIVEDTLGREGLVVVTGGEPLLYYRGAAFPQLLTDLRSHGREIHLESNGTIYPGQNIVDLFDVIVLSPKLPNAGTHRGSQSPSLSPGWVGSSRDAEIHLKFVCEDGEDVALAASIARSLGWQTDRVWVMPEGDNVHEIMAKWPAVVQAAIDVGVNASNRLHVLAWGDERGR